MKLLLLPDEQTVATRCRFAAGEALLPAGEVAPVGWLQDRPLAAKYAAHPGRGVAKISCSRKSWTLSGWLC